ncbi:probable signal peptidase complex subunit 2 [Cephus cinctus]|uniref:Signal peptidase complex subunit 2 n=1 Tax=Cephus cinctus TaxID=211228 RepID=A0AAJ7FTC9_CEPCN|nr:probable signal peptidase complex subunit 2 [Cephus cinctus]
MCAVNDRILCFIHWIMFEMASKKEQKENETPVIKVNKWDGSAVKNALDDAVRDVLIRKYNYIENFSLLDGRLALCGVAVGVATVALLWDYLYPFPTSKPVLVGCVSIYFILMGILTLYTTYKEKGIFTVAIQRDPAGFDPDLVWEASSYLKKYDDKYNLVLSVKTESSVTLNETSVTKSVANFIDVNGVVIPELVEAVVTSMHDSLTSHRKEK